MAGVICLDIPYQILIIILFLSRGCVCVFPAMIPQLMKLFSPPFELYHQDYHHSLKNRGKAELILFISFILAPAISCFGCRGVVVTHSGYQLTGCLFVYKNSPGTYQRDFLLYEADQPQVWVSFDKEVRRCASFLRRVFSSTLLISWISVVLDLAPISIRPIAASRPSSNLCRKWHPFSSFITDFICQELRKMVTWKSHAWINRWWRAQPGSWRRDHSSGACLERLSSSILPYRAFVLKYTDK